MNYFDFFEQLNSILDPAGILTSKEDTEIYNTDWRKIYKGKSLAVLKPQTTEQIAKSMQICAKYNIAVVPQGGNTSLVGGAIPSTEVPQIILNLSRMNKIKEINTIDSTITVEAGAILEDVQRAVQKQGLYFPIMISSQGSAQIGGIIATNAGGNNTLRYGNTREFVLGLEIVTPEGKILNILRKLRKDNTGYALKQLFIGSEGTLGIITQAVLSLHPYPKSSELTLCALENLDKAIAFLKLINNYKPSALQAFEYISQQGMELVSQYFPNLQFPLSTAAPVYIIVELALPSMDEKLRETLETILEKAFENNLILDAVIAESETQRQNIWRFREEQAESQKLAGANIKNDVSVPIASIPEFIAKATQECEKFYPHIRVTPFGHLGDGNIHFNLVQPSEDSASNFMSKSQELMNIVSKIVLDLNGSFSAEHGVGQLKSHMMTAWRGGEELELMKRIKQALDPKNLLNPGKIFP